MGRTLFSKIFAMVIYALLFATNSAFAARVSSPWFKIIQLDGYSNTAGGVVTADNNIDPVCSTSSGHPGAGFRYGAGKSAAITDGVKLGMSILLSAFMTGKEVQVDYDNSSIYCYIYLVRMR